MIDFKGVLKEKKADHMEVGSEIFAEKKAEEFANESKEKFNKYFSNIRNKEVFETAIDFFTMKREL